MAQWTTTYNGLLAALESFVEDDSAEYVAAVQGCINRAEERIYRDLDMSLFNYQLPTALGSGVWTLAKPSDLKQSPTHNIMLTGYGHAERRSLAWVQQHGGSGLPQYFAEDDTTLYFAPTPNSAYAVIITFNKRWSPLGASTQTNWVTDNAADLLLNAALVESEKFLIAPERKQEFEDAYRMLLGPVRAFWRGTAQTGYEPINPTPTPQQTR